MTLKGDLDSISLADVFQTLSMTQQEGTLVVQNAEQHKRIFFSAKGVSLVTTGEKKLGKLGDLLVGLGKLTAEDLARALELHEEKSIRLGEALMEMELVTEADIESAVRQQIEEEIYDLFSWENASFEFIEGAPEDGSFEQEGLPVTKLTFNVNALIMEAARRIDEWDLIEKFIPTMKEIFVLEDKVDVSAYADKEQIVLGLLDGTRNVKEVVQGSHIPKFDVCKFLYRLLEDGKARRLEFDRLVDLGDEAVKGESLEDAIKFYEQAVEAKVKKRSDQMLARMRLAQALEYAGRKKEAAQHYKIIAEQKLEDGDVESSISIWHKVIDFDPLDLENKERLINLYIENRERLDANKSDMIQQIELSLFKNGRSLAMAFAYAGQTERAREVLHRLIELAPSNLELRKALVNIHFDGGDKAAAVEELESLVQVLLVQRDYENLLEIYRHILKIDPARSDVRKKIAMIEGGEMIREHGRKWVGKLVALVLVLVVLGGAGAVVFYQMQALDRWETVSVEADEMWKRGERQKAREMLQSLRADLPYSLVGSKIDRKLQDFDDIEATEKEKREFSLRSRIQKAQVAYEDLVKVLHASSAPLDDPALEARIDDIAASVKDNPYAENLPEKLAREKAFLRDEIQKYRTLLQRAEELEREAESTGKYDVWLPEAWKVWLRLYEEGRRVPSVWTRVRLPLRLETEPQGAQALVNGKARYVTPILFHKQPGERVEVEVSRWGYDTETFAFETVDLRRPEPTVKHCYLRRKLTIQQLFPRVSFTGRVSSPPVTADGVLVIATIVTGKVFVFRLENDRLVTQVSGRKLSDHPLNYGFDTRPAAVRDRVFLGCQDGRVYAFPSGALADAVAYDTGIGESGKLGVDGGGVALDTDGRRLFVATTQGLYAFHLDERRLLWHFPTRKPMPDTPVLHQGRLYVGCADAHLYCLPLEPDRLEGRTLAQPLWKIALPAAPTSVPVVHQGRLYVAAGEAVAEIPLDAVDPDDPSTWKIPGTPLAAGGTVRGRPVFYEDSLCFSSLDGYVYAVSVPGLDKVLWKFNAGQFRSARRSPIAPCVRVGDSLFLGNGEGRFFSVHAGRGTLNWFRELEGRISLPAAVSEQGVVFVVSHQDEKVHIFGFRE